MKCSENKKIDQWLDNELKVQEKVAFEVHLKDCSLCQKELETSQALKTMLQSTSLTIEPSSDFEANLWKKVYAREQKSWISKLLKDIEMLMPTPTLSQAFATLILALFIGGAGGAVSAINTLTPQDLKGARTSIQYLSGFHEMNGIPSSSVTASFLKAFDERKAV